MTKDGKTHDVAGGAVAAVSATAITVESADGTTTAQQVLVVGTGTSPFAATRVLARRRRPPPRC